MYTVEESLAQAMNKCAIQCLQTQRDLAGDGTVKSYNLIDLPINMFVKIFSLVGDKNYNPQPRIEKYLKMKSKFHVTDNDSGNDKNYAVKNLLSLRRVCSFFEDAINNEMRPGLDYDWVDIGVKIKGSIDSRAITFYKYGGTGSFQPATHLNRLRRFNEFQFEHIEKFERITHLWLVDMVLTEELFDKILSLDLTGCEKIEFVKILDVNFDSFVNIPTYIQWFLDTIDSPALVTFNSELFDPNAVFFPGVYDYSSLTTEMYADSPQKYHKMIRNFRNKALNCNSYRAHRTINLLNTTLTGSAHKSEPGLKYGAHGAQKVYTSNISAILAKKTSNKSREIRKSGKWHLKNVLSLLNQKPIKKKKAIFYHLKMLKKIAGEEPLLTSEEKAIIDEHKEEVLSREFLSNFPFLLRFSTPKRLYTEVKMEH